MVLNGQESSWVSINAGVPQGSILGHILFLVFISNIVDEVGCKIKLFADDTSIYAIVDSPLLALNALKSNMQRISRWASRWLVTFNPKKTESICKIFSRKIDPDYHPRLLMDGNVIKTDQSHKHIFSSEGSLNNHIIEMIRKTSVFYVFYSI